MNENITVLNNDDFDQFLKEVKEHSSLVLLFKPNCPHCKILKTVIDKVLPTFPNLNLAGIDSIASPELMERLETSRVPSLLFIKNEKIVAKKSGIMNPAEMTHFINGAMIS
jgi:thioredoxin 1